MIQFAFSWGLLVLSFFFFFLDLWSIRLSAFEKYLFIFQSCLEFGYFLFNIALQNCLHILD